MIEISIPGRKEKLEIEHLVLDLNGTLALDGVLLPGVEERITALAKKNLLVHILTADTFGTATGQFKDIICQVVILSPERQALQKETFVKKWGEQRCIAIGNGMNDINMLRTAALGIGITGPEGAATEALLAADIVIPSITAALDLILFPKRLIATLRI